MIESPIYIRMAAAAITAAALENVKAFAKYHVLTVPHYGADHHEIVSSHRTLKAAHRALSSFIAQAHKRDGRKHTVGAYVACPRGALLSWAEARDMLRRLATAEREIAAQAQPGNDGVSLMTLPDGRLLMVEPESHTKNLTRRCFHEMVDGSLEWAAYDDVQENGTRARFYGYASRDLPATMRAGA